jgi:hypothetical protein
MRNTFTAAALLTVLLTAGSAGAQPVCGDVDESNDVTTTDALAVLKSAVGQAIELTCDRCGSTCVGDPRYLLGEWLFQSDFDGTVYEDAYSLFAVDEVYCEIVGQDLDDYGIVYAYAGEDYDYVLLDENETYCDVFVFDYTGPDAVDGYDLPYDLDVDGYCDFNAPFEEGIMIGDRLATMLARASVANTATANTATATTGSAAAATASKPRTLRSSRDLKPELAALVERARSNYARHRPH